MNYISAMKVKFKNSKQYINNYDFNNKIFSSFGFIDSSYSNDLCASYCKISHDETRAINIMFPNSANDNPENEEFNTYQIYDSYNNSDDRFCIFTDTLEEIFSIIKSNEIYFNNYLNNKKER